MRRVRTHDFTVHRFRGYFQIPSKSVHKQVSKCLHKGFHFCFVCKFVNIFEGVIIFLCFEFKSQKKPQSGLLSRFLAGKNATGEARLRACCCSHFQFRINDPGNNKILLVLPLMKALHMKADILNQNLKSKLYFGCKT